MNFDGENKRKRDYLENLEVDRRIILKWILNGMRKFVLEACDLGWVQAAGLILKKDPVPWE
jgi:hypothetical protein